MTGSLRKDRSGMTLIELLIALTVFLVVVTGALSAFQTETRVFVEGNDRLTMLQNYRFALNVVEQDLRVAGSGVSVQQPVLVYAGTDVVAFNADYASNTQDDISAVFIDTAASAAETRALPLSRRTLIPGTSFFYPDTTYLEGGANGPAETLILFFTEDSATTREDDYELYRQVNDLEPELVARNLLKTGTTHFFTYYEVSTSDTAPSQVAEVPSVQLPLRHSAPIHGSPADTGASAHTDAIRAIRVNATATNGLSGDDERTLDVTRLIWLPNVGLTTTQSCGGTPLAVDAPAATGQINATSGDPEVLLAWNRSPDEGGGESDIVRYVIWRRLYGLADWGSPYLSIPAGAPSYTYVDASVEPGAVYEYAVSAQDCTPALSELSGAVTVTVPTP